MNASPSLPSLNGKRILITGADGFIGSHLVEQCVKQGAKVRAFVWYSATNHRGWLEQIDSQIASEIEVFAGDVRDPFGVKQAMQGCDWVLHLAALIAIPYSYYSPQTYIETNITGTLNILQAARELETERVIHTSTSEVYGTAQFVPITEAHPLNAQSPYAASKVGADQLALSYYRSFETPVAIIRPFNTYGPRQSARAVIPTIISQIASGKESIQLGALSPTRDFNYIEDTVSGFISMANASDIVGEVINIGSEFEISIGETAKIISELMHREVLLVEDQNRLRPKDSEVERLFACSQKAQQRMQWVPCYGGLEGFKKGLQTTIDWFVNEDNLALYKVNEYAL